MFPFTQLDVWKDARKLAVRVHVVTRAFPAHELYGLTSQLRRAAGSVTANIAEGSKKDSRLDFARYLNVAEGSCAEAQSWIYIAGDLGYLTAEQTHELLVAFDRIAKMLCRLKTVVRLPKRQPQPPTPPS